jgi:hypothetical protein
MPQLYRPRRKSETLYVYPLPMDEQRKYALLLAATILAAGKLAQYDKPCPAIKAAIADAITMTEKILTRIDARHPTKAP